MAVVHQTTFIWVFSLISAATVFGQDTVPAGIFTNRIFRPSLFVDRPATRWPDATPRSAIDAARYSSYQAAYRGIDYYDSITDSSYGLDAARGLYEPLRVYGYVPQPPRRIDSWYGSVVSDPYYGWTISTSTGGTYP